MKTWFPPASAFAVCTLLGASGPARAQTIAWTTDTVATNVPTGTRVAFGPDGRLYALEANGRLHIFTLGRDHKPIATQLVTTIATYQCCTAWTCLGLAFDPLGATDSVRVYIARTRIYQSASAGAYLGRITKLTGPNFDVPVDVITGLSQSRMDHGTNAIWFASDGQLYIQCGGNTNAGAPGPGLNGNRDEGPLSAATLIAHVRRPGFDGVITYDNPDPALAHQVGGLDVEPFCFGERNPYGLVEHSNGHFYGTDNGANADFNNPTMWSCDSLGPPVTTADRLNLLERGNYYGHPDRNRSATDVRQCYYHLPTDGPILGHTPPIYVPSSSTDGLCEYRADVFGGAMRGDLVLARYGSYVSRAQLSTDGRSVRTYTQPFPIGSFGALDVCQGPDGTLYAARYLNGDVVFMAPVDPGPANGPHAIGMWPERGPWGVTRAAKIVGTRLGLGPTPTVRLEGTPLAVTAADSGSIGVALPSTLAPGWHDLVVTTPEGADTLTRAYLVIKPNIAMDDHIPPIVDVPEPERRYYDLAPPAFTLTAHDRLGLDSVKVSFDGGPWQTLVAGCPDSSARSIVTVPAAQWLAASAGPHTVTYAAIDDAHNVTTDGWTWFKGLPAAPAWRINCGGPAATTSSGLAFAADYAFDDGHAIWTSATIANTPDPMLYLNAREGDGGGTLLDYQLSIPARSYQARFHFAEIDSAFLCPGCRVFDARANGDTLVRGLDLFSMGPFTAVDLTRDVVSVDGQLHLDFPAHAGVALVSAFELYPLGLDDVTPPVIADIPQPQGVVYTASPVVTLSASDPADGELAGIWYATDGGPLQPGVRQLHRKSIATSWQLPLPVFQGLTPGTHTLRLYAVDLAGHVTSTSPWTFGRSSIVGVGPSGTPEIALAVAPNPSRGTALAVRLVLPLPGVASLDVFDVAGRVATRRDLGWRPAGASQLTLELPAGTFPPGLYFVRLRAPGVDRVQRLVRLGP